MFYVGGPAAAAVVNVAATAATFLLVVVVQLLLLRNGATAVVAALQMLLLLLRTRSNGFKLDKFRFSKDIGKKSVKEEKRKLLSRYTYLVDFDQLNRDVSYEDEESHIIEIEGIYSLDANWDLGAKYAFKDKRELFTRQSGEDISVDSNMDRNQLYLKDLAWAMSLTRAIQM